MKEIKGTIEYTLTLNEETNQWSIDYNHGLENNMATLVMAHSVMGAYEGKFSEDKAGAKCKFKQYISAEIDVVVKAKRGLHKMFNFIMNTYDMYQEGLAAKEKLKDNVIITVNNQEDFNKLSPEDQKAVSKIMKGLGK